MEAMNNAALQAFFDKFGNRISAIVFDNKNILYIGHPSAPVKTVDELILETIGGCDFVGVPVPPTDPKAREKGVMFTHYHPTSFIQAICTSDENHPDYLVDPFNFG